MGVLADFQIEEQIKIVPFIKDQVSKGVVSYGVTSYGYDTRVGNKFRIFTNVNNSIIDPKALSPQAFVHFEGDVCIIPPNSFILAETVEYFEIPRDVLAICVGKSTYARCGLIVNVTPLEPCLSSDSEALTDKGWKNIGDVEVGDWLLTRREDGVAEYRQVERKQERNHSGELLHFDGRSVDQLVTEDHKLAVRLRNSRNNTDNFKLIEAREVFGKYNYSFDRQVSWEGVDVGDSVQIGKSKFPTDCFLRFLGCWLGDGSAYVGNDGGYHIKLAVVTKEQKREYFRGVLDSLGVKYSLEERGFHFFSKDLCSYLMQFGHARDKYIDRKWLSLPPDKLLFLLEGLMESDGTKSTNTYTTASKRLADDVQEVIFKMGSAAIVREVTESVLEGKPFTAFKIRICDDSLSPKMPPDNHRRVAYSGMVYDVTVPNHVFFCRRNGKASWTGNCWRGKITIEISNTTPLPAKVYANEGIAQLVFFKADQPCKVSYEDRKGKYQDQPGLVLPFVK
jgi:deoxycytidine triphosphate deaminase